MYILELKQQGLFTTAFFISTHKLCLQQRTTTILVSLHLVNAFTFFLLSFDIDVDVNVYDKAVLDECCWQVCRESRFLLNRRSSELSMNCLWTVVIFLENDLSRVRVKIIPVVKNYRISDWSTIDKVRCDVLHKQMKSSGSVLVSYMNLQRQSLHSKDFVLIRIKDMNSVVKPFDSTG